LPFSSMYFWEKAINFCTYLKTKYRNRLRGEYARRYLALNRCAGQNKHRHHIENVLWPLNSSFCPVLVASKNGQSLAYHCACLNNLLL
jgi:hypothetical protein